MNEPLEEYDEVINALDPLIHGPGIIIELGMLSSCVNFELTGERWIANQALVKKEIFDDASQQRGWVIPDHTWARLVRGS